MNAPASFCGSSTHCSSSFWNVLQQAITISIAQNHFMRQFPANCQGRQTVPSGLQQRFKTVQQRFLKLKTFLWLKKRYLRPHCSPYHSPGLSSWSVLFNAQLHLFGTHYLHSSATAALWRPSNIGWNYYLLFCLAYDCSVHVWHHRILASTPYGTLYISLLLLLLLLLLL